MSLRITAVEAYEIIDSRGNPTIEATVRLSDGSMGRGQAPSGASTGTQEAIELRDDDPKRFMGKGVLRAIKQVSEEISNVIVGQNPYMQEKIDSDLIEIDGTVNKSHLGGNAMLAVSIAVAEAAACSVNEPLFTYMGGEGPFKMPVPMMNIINGGAHANNTIDIQEFMIVPVDFPSFSESLRAGVEIYHHLKAELQKKGLNTAVGDEGGFAPNLASSQEVLDLMMKATELAGYELGRQIYFALDVAASELYREGHYHLTAEKKRLDANGLIDYYQTLLKQYPIISIEDGLDENDWQGWMAFTEALGNQIQLVGDDIFVTNMTLLNRGIREHAGNAILIKPNQIGTVTETLQCIGLAKRNQFQTVISHRSGETESSVIADLAVATSAGQIKTGAPCRSDRVAKYNQLLRIEHQLKSKAIFPGKKAFAKL